MVRAIPVGCHGLIRKCRSIFDGYPHWSVTVRFSIMESNHRLIFFHSIFFKVFTGNSDQYSVVTHSLKNPIITRYLRVKPKTWYGYISLRAEFYGCRQGGFQYPTWLKVCQNFVAFLFPWINSYRVAFKTLCFHSIYKTFLKIFKITAWTTPIANDVLCSLFNKYQHM